MPRIPRGTEVPIVKLLLSPTQTAIACGVRLERVQDAVASGALVTRRLGMKHRISVPNIMAWYATWPEVEKRKKKGPSHA
jgi:hypothetical protein